ncbi:MAG TPA: hypothetical protein DD400_02145, partial [Rhodospirillaceae bacterium]|nr:hypothetical protein [Rhodospirillaceae bacterium]
FFLHGDAQKAAVEECINGPRTQKAFFCQSELRTVFPNYLDATLAWYNETYTPEQVQGMADLVARKLNGFEPDIIFTLFTPTPFLRYLFPDALILNGDNAFLSRQPFPLSITLDPCGPLRHSFLNKHSDALLNLQPTSDEAAFLEAFRQKYRPRLMEEGAYICTIFPRLRERFKHLVLLPLNVSGTFSFDGNTSFRSQWDYLCHFLDHTPPDVGVIVTQHVDYEKIITPSVYAYLYETYPNFIYWPRFDDYRGVSQFLLPHVDAVVGVSSSLCFQALLWGKVVCSLGTSLYDAFADAHNIEELVACLEGAGATPRDGLLSFLFTSFSFPEDKQVFLDPAWLEPTFTRWIAHAHAHGTDINFFEPWGTSEDLIRVHRLRSNF